MLLLTPISIEEIKRAIKAFKYDKVLGPDGLSVEFYKANLSWISKDLFDFYNETISVGSLSPEINRGIIKLLPNKGDKTLIKNWRPISLLNISYKILVKVLALRFIHILPKFGLVFPKVVSLKVDISWKILILLGKLWIGLNVLIRTFLCSSLTLRKLMIELNGSSLSWCCSLLVFLCSFVWFFKLCSLMLVPKLRLMVLFLTLSLLVSLSGKASL